MRVGMSWRAESKMEEGEVSIVRQDSFDSLNEHDDLRTESKDVWRGGGAVGYSSGGSVERNIDGMWFTATVLVVDETRKELRVRYDDDHKVEERVPFDEVRPRVASGRDVSDRPVEFTSTQVVDTLAKPLEGLIDDDADARLAHRPTVVIHSCADSEEAIILNGAENRLAAGGGLRALRHLKKLKGTEDDDEQPHGGRDYK